MDDATINQEERIQRFRALHRAEWDLFCQAYNCVCGPHLDHMETQADLLERLADYWDAMSPATEEDKFPRGIALVVRSVVLRLQGNKDEALTKLADAQSLLPDFANKALVMPELAKLGVGMS